MKAKRYTIAQTWLAGRKNEPVTMYLKRDGQEPLGQWFTFDLKKARTWKDRKEAETTAHNENCKLTPYDLKTRPWKAVEI